MGEKTIKQLDPCHKAMVGEVQERRVDTEPRPGRGSDSNINPGVMKKYKSIHTIVSAHLPQHCTVTMVGFSSNLEGKCGTVRLKMQS